MLQLQLQQVQPYARGHPPAIPRSSKRSLAICQATRRGVQQADRQEASSTTTTSNDLQVSIAVPIEQAPPAHQQGQSSFGVIGALAAAAVAAGLIFKKLRSNGYDPFARDYMQSINAMQTDDLDPEIIAAARARRSRERANHRLDLDEVELPENHPWATRKPMTPEQEAAIQARLQARPRRAAQGDGRSAARSRQLGGE